MSQADRDRYARDKARIRARQKAYTAKHGEKWKAARKLAYANDAVRQTRAIWRVMIQRCTDPKHRAYSYYGGRGITVCELWRNSFDEFLKEVGVRPEGLTIERIDNSRGYEPGNCCWATRSQQMRNRRMPPPSCICGQCKKCRSRFASRRYQERKRAQCLRG